MTTKPKIWKELILTDSYFPEEDKPSINCVYKTIKKIRPDGITLAGDIGNWDTFSRHSRFSPPKCHWTDSQFLENSQHEYDSINLFLDTIDKLVPKARKRFLWGNHENWVDDFIAESKKSRAPQFDITERLMLKERGYTTYPYGEIVSLGKLRITHGLYTTQNHSKKHVEMMGRSILYGHCHDIQVCSKTTPENISHMAWCIGCLCNLNPDYLRGKPQNWNHGFAIVYLHPDSMFQVDVKRITKGKVMVQGKLLDGNKK